MSFVRILLIALAITLTACANLQTIERRTSLPFSQIKSSDSQNASVVKGTDGVAIHLDAQQRLVMFHMNKYCAEPSPDALAAYAASLGLGASTASKNAVSLAQGMQSSAGSIGLRTQSITLMRDALYRMCEAASNGSLNSIEIAKLLHQSQDLTAVILAVEQLTGAVAANQIILSGTTSSSATASLISNQQALDSVRKSEADKKKDFEDATTAKQAAETVVTKKQAEQKTAEDRVKNPPPNTTDSSNAEAKADFDKKQVELTQAENDQKNAKDQFDLRKKIYDDAVTLRQQVEVQKDSALANANAATSTSGQFSIPVQRVVLDKDATTAIANSVQGMVQSVLTKDYSSDACMSYLTQPNPNPNPNPIEQDIREFCKELVRTTAWIAQKKLDDQRAMLEAEFEKDDSTETLTNCIKDQNKKVKLGEWLKSKKSSSIPITIFLYGKEFVAARKEAIDTGVCK